MSISTSAPMVHREQLAFLLSEAAEIEHNLMCCYLYAGFSLKDETDGLNPVDAAQIDGWRKSIRAVAVEEMLHLSLVSNLLTAIGAAPHFGRLNFPIPPGSHPARIVVELHRFEMATLDHFVFLERPEGIELPDGPGYEPRSMFVRGARVDGLMPNAHDYDTVGRLYAGIADGFRALVERLGEKAVFVGDPAAQVGPDLLQLPGMTAVIDLATALQAIATIVHQGEGSPSDAESSHYQRFIMIRDELRELQRTRPDFDPARPVARNPVMRRPPIPEGRVWINAPGSEELLDLANATYVLSLRLLCQGFGWAGAMSCKRVLIDAAIDCMFAVAPLAETLAQRPANAEVPGVTAGISFALLRAITPLPHGTNEWSFLAERAREVAHTAHALTGLGPRVERARETLDRVAENLERERLRVAHARVA